VADILFSFLCFCLCVCVWVYEHSSLQQCVYCVPSTTHHHLTHATHLTLQPIYNPKIYFPAISSQTHLPHQPISIPKPNSLSQPNSIPPNTSVSSNPSPFSNLPPQTHLLPQNHLPAKTPYLPKPSLFLKIFPQQTHLLRPGISLAQFISVTNFSPKPIRLPKPIFIPKPVSLP